MHPIVRALSVAVLAGAVLGGGASAVVADPAAEVGPGTVRPGGTVTVSVSCDPVGGAAPDALDASSQAFDPGTVKLQHVPASDDDVSGPAYRGTATIASGANADAVGGNAASTVDGSCPAAPGEKGQPWSTAFTVDRGSAGGDAGDGGACGDAQGLSCGDAGTSCTEQQSRTCGDDGLSCAGATGTGAGSRTDPAGQPCSATHSAHPTAPSTPAPVQQGVRAGAGGSYAPSVPALVAGGVLIAVAIAGAVYRMRRKGEGTGV